MTHSEFNPSASEAVHLLQIWIIPDVSGIGPSYEQKHFGAEDKRGRLRVVASKDGREGSVTIHQDAAVHAGLLGPGQLTDAALAPSRLAYLHVARGNLLLDDTPLGAGDGAKISATRSLHLTGADGGAEILLFDLPG